MTRTNPSRSRSAEASDGNADVYQVCSPPSSASTTASGSGWSACTATAMLRSNDSGVALCSSTVTHATGRPSATAAWTASVVLPKPAGPVTSTTATSRRPAMRSRICWRATRPSASVGTMQLCPVDAEDPGELGRRIGRVPVDAGTTCLHVTEPNQGVRRGCRRFNHIGRCTASRSGRTLVVVQAISCEGVAPAVRAWSSTGWRRHHPPRSSTERHDDRRLEPWRRYVPCWRPWST